jgi:glycosyltransferase involved in cell wall biosynthesis
MPRHEVAATMGGADALVISSHSESGPTIALEGLASGLPVTSTPVGRIRQLVDHQRTGFIASDHTYEALADGMRWVMSNPRGAHRDEVIASGRRYAAAKVLQPFYELHYRLAETERRA